MTDRLARLTASRYRHRVEFGGVRGNRPVDAAGGIELPLLDHAKIAGSRVVVGPTRKMDSYRHELRCDWGHADRLEDRAGSRFESEHTKRINGGKVKGVVFVSDDARQRVTVLNVSSDGAYAFGRTPAVPTDIFMHRNQCDQPLAFEPGQQLTCIVIQTPRGLQGRNIRPAETRRDSLV